MKFRYGPFGNDYWIAGLEDFLGWLSAERRKCIPRGPCGQDIATTSGTRGLMGKYPTFESAYRAYVAEIGGDNNSEAKSAD